MNWLQTKAVLMCLLILLSHSEEDVQNTYYFNADNSRYPSPHTD